VVQLLKKAEKLLGYIWICKMENKELKDVDFKAIEELGTNIRHYLIENNHYLC